MFVFCCRDRCRGVRPGAAKGVAPDASFIHPPDRARGHGGTRARHRVWRRRRRRAGTGRDASAPAAAAAAPGGVGAGRLAATSAADADAGGDEAPADVDPDATLRYGAANLVTRFDAHKSSNGYDQNWLAPGLRPADLADARGRAGARPGHRVGVHRRPALRDDAARRRHVLRRHAVRRRRRRRQHRPGQERRGLRPRRLPGERRHRRGHRPDARPLRPQPPGRHVADAAGDAARDDDQPGRLREPRPRLQPGRLRSVRARRVPRGRHGRLRAARRLLEPGLRGRQAHRALLHPRLDDPPQRPAHRCARRHAARPVSRSRRPRASTAST